MRWEYTFITLRYEIERRKRINELNFMGDEGWELVSVDNELAYFKRPMIDVDYEEMVERAVHKGIDDLRPEYDLSKLVQKK